MATRESKSVAAPGVPEIVFSRVFDAPREMVFDAWTDPEQVVHWWGPKGFSLTIHKMDVRVGGEWIFTMHGPDGVDYPNHNVFTEIVRPSLIAKTHGDRKDAPGTGFHMRATFETVEGDKTLLTMNLLFASVTQRDEIARVYGAVEGGRQTLDRLAAFLETVEVAA